MIFIVLILAYLKIPFNLARAFKDMLHDINQRNQKLSLALRIFEVELEKIDFWPRSKYEERKAYIDNLIKVYQSIVEEKYNDWAYIPEVGDYMHNVSDDLKKMCESFVVKLTEVRNEK